MTAQPFESDSGNLTSGLLDRLKAFEEAWLAGPPPAIEDFAPASGPQRLAYLAALVQVALERRLRAGEPARVEHYLQRFPELASDAAVVCALVRAEYCCRLRLERHVPIAEYAQRFPHLDGNMAEFLHLS